MTTRRDTMSRDKLNTSAIRIQSQKQLRLSKGSRKLNFNNSDKTFIQVARLEESLDKQEIALHNYLKSSPSQPEKELEMYKEFLQGVAYYTKQMNPELGACTLRGLQGIYKASVKIINQHKNSSAEPSKAVLVSQSCQISEPAKPKIQFEYELASLKEKLSKIEFADLTSQLSSIYNSLKNLHIEVPPPTEITSNFSLNFNDISHMIASALKLLKTDKTETVVENTTVLAIKPTIDRGVQVVVPSNEIQHYTSLLRDKEMEILNLNKSVDKIRRENAKAHVTETMMFEINKHKVLAERKEKSLNHVDCEKRYNELRDKLNRRDNNIKVYKRMVKDLNKRNLEKVYEVEKLSAECYENKLQFYHIAKTYSIDLGAFRLDKNDYLSKFEDDVTGEYVKRMKQQLMHSRENSDDEIEYVPYDLKIKVIGMKDQIKTRQSKLGNRNVLGSDTFHTKKMTRVEDIITNTVPGNREDTRAHKNQEISERESILKTRYASAERKDLMKLSARENNRYFNAKDTNNQTSSKEKSVDFKRRTDEYLSEQSVSEILKNRLHKKKKTNLGKIQDKIKILKGALEETKKYIKDKLFEDVFSVYEFNELGKPTLRVSEIHKQVIKKTVSTQTSILKMNDPVFSKSKTQEHTKTNNLKSLLSNVYTDEHELDAIDTNTRRELARVMQGHDPQACKGICPHLLRAMAIRARSRGIPYPLKHPPMPII